MKLKTYIESLQLLTKNHPERLDWEVIYSADDEGNAFLKVNFEPSLFQAEDLSQRYIESSEDTTTPNCICIN